MIKKIDTVKSAMQCQNIKKNEHWGTCFIFRSVQSTESVLDFFLVLKICHVHDYWLYLVLLTNVVTTKCKIKDTQTKRESLLSRSYREYWCQSVYFN